MVGNYEKAYELAKKANDSDSYNKMAFTVLAQSKIALEYVNYIKEGNEYFKKIDKISSKKEYSDADKVRIKLMCEIMLGNYKKLVPTKLTNKDLIKDAKKSRDKFLQLYKELF
jgi:tetratricopeptide (TPR) repeat protein